MSLGHSITISHEGLKRDGVLVLNGGHRASCSCGWVSDCYSQLSDTQRAIEVHLRRTGNADIDALIARSSIGAGIADIKNRGIDAHLVDLEREMAPKYRTKSKKAAPKLSAEDTAFMRGFGMAIASIWTCSHDRSLIRILLKENSFTLKSFQDIGLLEADYNAIKQAVQP